MEMKKSMQIRKKAQNLVPSKGELKLAKVLLLATLTPL
jgi:hypothetical protein